MLALALGIGATTTIFGLVNAVLLRPLPYPDPNRIVEIFGNVQREVVERREPRLPTTSTGGPSRVPTMRWRCG